MTKAPSTGAGHAAYHAEDVGRILLEAQKDLKTLRDQLPIESRDAQAVLARAESELRAKATAVLNHVQNDAASLRTVASAVSDHVGAAEVHAARTAIMQAARNANHTPATSQEPSPHSMALQRAAAAHHDSISKGSRGYASAVNPEIARVRQDLTAKYHLGQVAPPRPVPPGQRRRRQHGKIVHDRLDLSVFDASTARPAGGDGVSPFRRAVPRRGRSVGSSAQHGMIHGYQAPMHHPTTQRLRAQVVEIPHGFNLANVKLDLITRTDDAVVRQQVAAPTMGASQRALHVSIASEAALLNGVLASTAVPPPPTRTASTQQQQLLQDARRGRRGVVRGNTGPVAGTASDADDDDDEIRGGGGDGAQPGRAASAASLNDENRFAAAENRLASTTPGAENARGYNQLLDTFSLHQFIIRHGRVLDSTPEFQSFRRKYRAIWGSVAVLVRQMERLFTQYNIPVAYVDGRALVELAELDAGQMDIDLLLQCIRNADKVEPMLRIPGRRFLADDGAQAAAVKIQATWRMHWTRSRTYIECVRRRAAHRIQRTWRTYRNIQRMQQVLQEVHDRRLAQWRTLQQSFAQNWPSIKQRRRTIIHLPSMSCSCRQRMSLAHLTTKQAGHLSRLCDLADANVDVIYVSPQPVEDELLQYYDKLLSLRGVENPRSRYKIVTPEMTDRLPDTMSLAKLLYYSPRACARIRNFVKGRNAYIVPLRVASEELSLSLLLGVPLLAPEPDIAHAFASKSGARRIFTEADVNVPVGVHDIYSEDKLLTELSTLITKHVTVPRWLLKIDDEFGGRGHAFFDTAHLPDYNDMLKRHQSDPLWNSQRNQIRIALQVRSHLTTLLAQHAIRVRSDVYKSWRSFLKSYCKAGGVIEACHVPSGTTSPSANMLIEPNGRVSIISTHEQVLQPAYCFAAASFPQTSVPPAAINQAMYAIGRGCFAKGIIGYLGVDFITYFDQRRSRQVLMAVDLNLGMTTTQSSYQLFHYVMKGRFDVATGYYYVPEVEDDAAAGAAAAEGHTQAVATPAISSNRRYYTVCDDVYHEAMAMMHYSALFGLCRTNGIAFDLMDKFGTVFSLKDGYSRGIIGMMTVGRSVPEALRVYVDNLDFLMHQLALADKKGGSVPERSNMRDLRKAIQVMLAGFNSISG